MPDARMAFVDLDLPRVYKRLLEIAERTAVTLTGARFTSWTLELSRRH